jgi:SAM-dependent methyltransferase
VKAFADHFSGISTAYEAYRPRYPAGLFAALAGAAPARDLAWDCATGTGQAAGGLGEWFGTVVASDASRAQVRTAPHRARVAYVAAVAEAVPLASGSADLVTVAQALHWIELEPFYAEVHRVLAPGGLFAVWTYGRCRVDGGPIDAAVGHFYDDVVGAYWPPERRWVELGYAGLPFPFDEVTVPVPPMVEHWTRTQFLGYVSTWSAAVRCAQVTGTDPVRALGELLAPLWEGDAIRRVQWDLTLRAGR